LWRIYQDQIVPVSRKMLFKSQFLYVGLMSLAPERRGIDAPFRESFRVLGLYIRGQILIAAILTVLYAIGFGVAHVPLWPVIAVLGGLANFIPRIGSLIPLGLVALANLLGDRNLTHLMIACIAWIIVQILEGFFITPTLLGKPLGLRALPVFLALLAGGFFFGPIGVLLAVPILAVGMVFWRHFRSRPN
jgi:predicted PurR-regulated permease PerM